MFWGFFGVFLRLAYLILILKKYFSKIITPPDWKLAFSVPEYSKYLE